MATVARWTDYQGRVVELTDEGWAHILEGHADMADRLAEVESAVETPILVVRDPDIRRVEHHYGVSKGRLRVRVIVLYRPTPEGWVGSIVTSPKAGVSETFIWPEFDDQALDRVRVDDVADIDYLYVFLLGKPVPAAWDPVGDGDAYVGFRIEGDDVFDEVVGIMIAWFREVALRRHPAWERVVTETGPGRRAALRNLIVDVAAMPLSGIPWVEDAT